MSIADFIKDPESYARSHPVQFGAIGPSAAGMRAVRSTKHQGWSAIRYEQEPAHFTDFAFSGDTVHGYLEPSGREVPGWHVRLGRAALHNVEGKPGWQDKGICFLPWGENAVTYLRIPGSAKTFFTGPLSGCSIYIGEGADGSLWAFHANRNNVEGRQRNAAVKHAMTSLTIQGLDVAVRGKHAALSGQHYHHYAFVFGKKSWLGRWSFYVADLAGGAPMRPCTVTSLP